MGGWCGIFLISDRASKDFALWLKTQSILVWILVRDSSSKAVKLPDVPVLQIAMMSFLGARCMGGACGSALEGSSLMRGTPVLETELAGSAFTRLFVGDPVSKESSSRSLLDARRFSDAVDGSALIVG